MKHLLILLSCLPWLTALAQDPWNIEARHIDPSNYYGETAANGMLGIVSSPKPLKTSNVVLAGSYDKFGRGEVSNFLAGFNFLDTDLYIDGTFIDNATITDYRQTLDMRHSAFRGIFTLKGKAQVTYTVYALQQLPFCGMMTVDIKPLSDITIRAVNKQLLPEAYQSPKPRFQPFNVNGKVFRLMSTEAQSPTGKLTIAACSEFLFPADNARPNITAENITGGIAQQFSHSLKKGQAWRFVVAGSTMSTAHHSDPINEVKRMAITCQLDGVDRIVARHLALWGGLWKSDIQIDGDPQSQQDIHAMMYHLYAFLRPHSRMSVSPMGLSGNGYNGHVFWDADTWMFPPLLLLQPDRARSMVDYRYDRLAAARRYAFIHGYRGAMFPWESADTGFEDTPVTALTGPYEHHISACVALAAWQYYCVMHDADYLRQEAWPILRQTADFWVSRVEKAADGYHINNVVAADEWAENVDDNAFTNGAARQNLLSAIKAARILRLDSRPEWQHVADSLVFIVKDGVTMEHAAYHGEDIKQADVNLLAFPLKLITDRRQTETDLAYYARRVPEKDTPAMTQAMFALLYARLGNADLAWHYFKDSYRPNQLPPFGVIAECKGGTNPYFITGAGGVLQAMLMGFGGIDISYDAGSLTQVPSVLPRHWRKLTITNVGPEGKTFTMENTSRK